MLNSGLSAALKGVAQGAAVGGSDASWACPSFGSSGSGSTGAGVRAIIVRLFRFLGQPK